MPVGFLWRKALTTTATHNCLTSFSINLEDRSSESATAIRRNVANPDVCGESLKTSGIHSRYHREDFIEKGSVQKDQFCENS